MIWSFLKTTNRRYRDVVAVGLEIMLLMFLVGGFKYYQSNIGESREKFEHGIVNLKI